MSSLAESRLVRPLLRMPLFGKLIGANAIILGISALLLSGVGASLAPIAISYDYFVLAGLSFAALINVWLVRVALQPIRELQRVAGRVAGGAWQERAKKFPHADSRISRLIETTNQMLDRLAADRDRMRKLGAEVVYAQETERADVARELHESVAQTLAAASLQLTGALSSDPGMRSADKVKEARDLLGSALEELRAVSQSLHPRVATDLGLPSALESLAVIVRQRSLIEVFVVMDVDIAGIPGQLSTTLYRVAKEALHNVELRGDANSATIALKATGGSVELTIVDDGSGQAASGGPGDDQTASFRTARDRFSLAGGEMHIDRVANGGTRVLARIVTPHQAA